VRNVANLVPPFETQGKFHGVSAALEFAALNIRVKHIVVLGHSGCGGVRACLEHDAAKQTKAEFIRNWMSMLDDAREKVIAEHEGKPAATLRGALEREGIKTSLANLRTFPCIQILEGRGSVQLHGAYFDIASGMLEVLDREVVRLHRSASRKNGNRLSVRTRDKSKLHATLGSFSPFCFAQSIASS
jgi:carbonic anhydrase